MRNWLSYCNFSSRKDAVQVKTKYVVLSREVLIALLKHMAYILLGDIYLCFHWVSCARPAVLCNLCSYLVKLSKQ